VRDLKVCTTCFDTCVDTTRSARRSRRPRGARSRSPHIRARSESRPIGADPRRRGRTRVRDAVEGKPRGCKALVHPAVSFTLLEPDGSRRAGAVPFDELLQRLHRDSGYPLAGEGCKRSGRCHRLESLPESTVRSSATAEISLPAPPDTAPSSAIHAEIGSNRRGVGVAVGSDERAAHQHLPRWWAAQPSPDRPPNAQRSERSRRH
jgi:hypothetical protein